MASSISMHKAIHDFEWDSVAACQCLLTNEATQNQTRCHHPLPNKLHGWDSSWQHGLWLWHIPFSVPAARTGAQQTEIATELWPFHRSSSTYTYMWRQGGKCYVTQTSKKSNLYLSTCCKTQHTGQRPISTTRWKRTNANRGSCKIAKKVGFFGGAWSSGEAPSACLL